MIANTFEVFLFGAGAPAATKMSNVLGNAQLAIPAIKERFYLAFGSDQWKVDPAEL